MPVASENGSAGDEMIIIVDLWTLLLCMTIIVSAVHCVEDNIGYQMGETFKTADGYKW